MSAEVAIVILTKNNPDLVSQCVSSVLEHTHNVQIKFYICDTGSDQDHKLQLITTLKHMLTPKNCKFLEFEQYHFAGNNNYAINNCIDEPYVLLCNDDIILQNDCVDQMYKKIVSDNNISTVGCRLIFPDGKIQHGGQHVYVDPTGLLQCTHRGYGDTNQLSNDTVVGCTAACLLIDRDKFTKCGGFDETYTECWEDVQLNMRYVITGYSNWYLDTAVAIHLESQTRTKTKQAKYRLRYDYTYKLKPWFDSLPGITQQLILNA